jgi:hypothetical protein
VLLQREARVVVLQPLDSTAPEIIPNWAAQSIVAKGTLERSASLTVLKYSRVDLADEAK